MLELAFESKPLRTVCETEVQAKLELEGATVAEILKHRLADCPPRIQSGR